jgi:hypothetical protein
MSFSYLCIETLDNLDLESFEDGDAIHLRRKSTKEIFDLTEETRLFMELYKKHGVEIRSQWQHKGFWGTAPRNDGKRSDFSLPQCPDDYEYNRRTGAEPTIDIWPRMYTAAWLVAT